MSTVLDTPPTPVRTSVRIPAGVKGASIAARASGLSQRDIPKQFSVHPNTVQRVCAQVAKVNHPANPLANDWKSTARSVAQRAVIDGMEQRKDVVSAANIGIKVLQGIGDLQSTSNVTVDGSVAMQLSWTMPQVASGSAQVAIESERNVTPIAGELASSDTPTE